MHNIDGLVDKYCNGWSSNSAEERERLIRETLTEDAIYSDPRVNCLRISELLNHISSVHTSRPGAKVLRTSKVDIHHGFARFNWRVFLSDGSALPESVDIVELNADGSRFQKILGFFGPLQSLTDRDA